MGLISLASASLNANPEVSKTLVATRANAHAMKTPLFFAARNNGHSEVIELLLSATPPRGCGAAAVFLANASTTATSQAPIPLRVN